MTWGSKHLLLGTVSMLSAFSAPLWLTTNSKLSREQLIPAKPIGVLSQQLPISVPVKPSLSRQIVAQGRQISLNGRILPVSWSQWHLGAGGGLRIGVSDGGLAQTIGLELLSNQSLTRQPVQWYSEPQTEPFILATRASNQSRYLDITDLAIALGWQFQINGDTLQLNLPLGEIQNIELEPQSWGNRIILYPNRPTPWQVNPGNGVLNVTLDAATNPVILERFHPKPLERVGEGGSGGGGENIFPLPQAPVSPAQPPSPFKIESSPNQTKIQVNIPNGLRPRVWSLSNPYRVIIDFGAEVMSERDILWASGIRYRQKYIELVPSEPNQPPARFPVVWLEINPRQPGLSIKPIWSNPNSLVGITPLIKMAQQWQAAAAINAGFFNRNTQLPLGAIRANGRWLSSPILDRGAIAWNDLGEFKIGRLSLQHTLITQSGERLPIVSLNSGYIQRGISRYTLEWGSTYSPLTDNETIITIQNNQIVSQSPATKASKTTFPIPSDGYLLAIRADTPSPVLTVGTLIHSQNITVPDDFSRYPQIVGAGPFLIQNNQIVLDAKAEQFRDSFIREFAARSAIGITQTGTLLIVTVGSRTGGPGLSLEEFALLMQQMGAVDALNLDGGSSASLYLGGQLLNRPPATAARVHNGLGIFIQPQP